MYSHLKRMGSSLYEVILTETLPTSLSLSVCDWLSRVQV